MRDAVSLRYRQSNMTTATTFERSFGKITLLVVDDDPSVSKAASRLLRLMGFDVRAAARGSEAVEMCHAGDPAIDALLLDARLEQSPSTEILRQIRSLQPDIKVILMSGRGRQESLDLFAGMPVEAFLAKPFGYDELEQAIRLAMKPSQAS